MPRWLPTILARIRELALRRQVRFTLKAVRELAELDRELDEEDACDILARLERRDFTGRQLADRTGEWMYVFKPVLGELVMYVKVILRTDCILISFHEDSHNGY